MGMKPKFLIGSMSLLALLAYNYQMEKIGEICAHTGSYVHYRKYFSIYTTENFYKPSWVEKALLEAAKKIAFGTPEDQKQVIHYIIDF